MHTSNQGVERGPAVPQRPALDMRDRDGGSRALRKRYKTAITDPALIRRAALDAVRKLDPRTLIKNPVIFVTAVVSALVTVLFVRDLVTGQPALFSGQIAAWLWFTVLFANFAEAIAEGRGRAQAEALRRAREETRAKRILMPGDNREIWEGVDASQLRPGDIVLVEAGDMIPGDGEVIEGIASVNEAAITGELAPVIREAGGDRSAVTGAPPSFPTGSWCGSRPRRVPRSSTA